MLAVLNRYKVFFIILAFIILTVLIWLLVSGQGNSKVPSRGTFVFNSSEELILTVRR